MLDPQIQYWKSHQKPDILFKGRSFVKKFIDKLWWKFMPGVTIKVEWPSGDLIVDHNNPLWQDMGGAVWVNLGYSSDPNDHYRPWMEKNVGKQGWDWNWGLHDSDLITNQLTIKFRNSKAPQAIEAKLRWG